MKKIILTFLVLATTFFTVIAQDADNDGVQDSDDACPMAKGDKTNKGCPEEKKILPQKAISNKGLSNFFGTFKITLFVTENNVTITNITLEKKIKEITNKQIENDFDMITADSEDSIKIEKEVREKINNALSYTYTFLNDFTYTFQAKQNGIQLTNNNTYTYNEKEMSVTLMAKSYEYNYNLKFYFNSKLKLIHTLKNDTKLAYYTELKNNY